MVACAMVTIVQVGSVLLPTWHGGYLVVLGFLISLEAFYSERFRKRLSPLDRDWYIFYLSEWLVLFILLKGILLLRGGFGSLLSEVAAWRVDFFGAFFNAEFAFSLVALFAAWLVSLSFAAPLEVLRVDIKNIQIEEDVGSAPDRALARQQLVDLVLLIGIVLVVLTSLMRNERMATWLKIPLPQAGAINVLVYFTLGLALLSLTQFSVLHMRWAVNRIQMSNELARRWALYSLLFLALLAIGSLLLPTGYTISLLAVLNLVVMVVISAYVFVSWLVTTAFMAIIYLLGLLKGTLPETAPLAPLPVPEQIPTPEPLAIAGLLALIRSIMLWAIILAMMGYALYTFIKLRRQDLSSLRGVPLIAWLANGIQRLKSWLLSLSRQATGAIQAGARRLRRAVPPALHTPVWRYTSLRRLTPRQRVVFYYLALVRRGGESGVPRKPAQTPYEYAEQLSIVLPESQATAEARPDAAGPLGTEKSDLENITERFLEARYSLHEVTPQQAGMVQESWQRLKRLLRNRKAG
jgi:hypothetical protein